MTQVIDLEILTQGKVKTLAGHDRGLAARDHFRLEELDVIPDDVEIRLPDDFRAVSPSFFQGMFSASVKKLGDLMVFFEHYRFNAPAHIRSQIIGYAEQSLGS